MGHVRQRSFLDALGPPEVASRTLGTGRAVVSRGMDSSSIREEATKALAALVGREAQLRLDQWTAIRSLVIDRARVLCVQRTGWGKSAVYFVATALLREAGSGPTLIVSPLLALMRNQ